MTLRPGTPAMLLRHQPPAYSPLSSKTLREAVLDSSGFRGGATAKLAGVCRERFRADRVILTGSGTQALTLAIRLARDGNRRGLPVALPAYSCYDLVTAAVGADTPMRFYDVDPVTLTPAPESVERVLADGLSALVAGNLYGFPLDWTSLIQRCRDAGAYLIEDAAQGLGSSWEGRPSGSFGDLTILSFGRGKGWAGGGGGALFLRHGLADPPPPDPAGGLSGLPETMRTVVVTVAEWLFGRPALFWFPSLLPWLGLGETRYHEPSPVEGIDPFSASLAWRTRDLAEEEANIRRENARRWEELLRRLGSDSPLRLLRCLEGGDAGFLRFPALLAEGSSIPEIPRVWYRLGVRRGYPRTLPELPAVAGRWSPPSGSFPGARMLAKRLLTLPTHSLLTARDRDRMAGFLLE